MKNLVEEISSAHFEEILSKETYAHWLEVLAKLVPHGRTQRLSIFVAGLLQYLWKKAQGQNENPLIRALRFACDGCDEADEIVAHIIGIIFRDAGVRPNRSDSRGHGYSIAESAANEFFRWYNMPWE